MLSSNSNVIICTDRFTHYRTETEEAVNRVSEETIPDISSSFTLVQTKVKEFNDLIEELLKNDS